MAVPSFEPLALDLVRQCAAEAGLREIHFSHVSRCVSFLDDTGVRINVYFSTATVGICICTVGPGPSAAQPNQHKTQAQQSSGAVHSSRAQLQRTTPQPKQQFLRNVTMTRLRQIFASPFPPPPPKNRLDAQMESGIFSLESYLKGHV